MVKRNREEATLQTQLIKALPAMLPRGAFFFAVPNGGKRGKIEAANLKRQGVRAGVPDIIIIHHGKAYGLELKSPKGTISDSQEEVFPLLRAAGMPIEIIRSLDDAMTAIGEFFRRPFSFSETRSAA